MKCLKCDGDYIEREGTLRLPDEYVGSVTVFNVAYLECEECQDILLPYATAKKIEKAQDLELQRILQSLPLGDFLTAAETAEIFKISRQALHKHRRISRGFIYQTQFGGKIVYLKKSVQLFKEQGDGRFLLGPQETPTMYSRGLESTIPYFTLDTLNSDFPPPARPFLDFVGISNTLSSRSIH